MPRPLFLAAALLLCGLLSACSQLPQTQLLNAPSVQSVLEGEALITRGLIQEYREPSEDVLSMNEDMRRFVHAYVPRNLKPRKKLDALLYALMHKGVLGLDYQPQVTSTAEQTFRNQRGNCVSFSLLFVAMARELGLRVSFNDVAVPPQFDLQEGSTVVMYKHINTLVDFPHSDTAVVDINLERYQNHYIQRRISDERAFAQYYNNRGVAHLVGGDLAAAYNYLRKGIEVAPKDSIAWGSLGTLYRRNGLLEEAEVAFLRGLELNRSNSTILSNLGYLYTTLGDTERAKAYHQQVLAVRERNPYYRYALAKNALEKNDLLKAMHDIDWALKRRDEEHKFWFLAAQIRVRLNGVADALPYLSKAMELVKDSNTLAHYQQTESDWSLNPAG